MLNIGYLTSNKNKDEAYTPYYAANPIIKYINPNLVVWCPFDQEWSAYVRLLRDNGNRVIAGHINNGLNFFNYEPDYYDIIVTNPPFSFLTNIEPPIPSIGSLQQPSVSKNK